MATTIPQEWQNKILLHSTMQFMKFTKLMTTWESQIFITTSQRKGKYKRLNKDSSKIKNIKSFVLYGTFNKMPKTKLGRKIRRIFKQGMLWR